MPKRDQSITPTAQPSRIAIVGTGNVGATFAYALLLSGLAAEIVLINRDQEEAEGEAMDLTHAVPFTHPTRIWSGGYEACVGAAVTVLTAGAPKGDRDSRLDLAQTNTAIFREIVPEVVRHNADGLLLVATNPVDVLTDAVVRLSGLPPERVIGSGTILDTARFRALLGDHFRVDPVTVQADVIGEHGDSQVPVWSQATIAGVPLATVARLRGVRFNQEIRTEIARQTRDAAAAVVERKGATSYAVAAGMTRIVEAILRDQRTVLTVSSTLAGGDDLGEVAISLPSVIGGTGIESVLRPPLSDDEENALRRSAKLVREAIESVSSPSAQTRAEAGR